jgi:LysR family hydrogen peroxide-inducible transcriptional activator
MELEQLRHFLKVAERGNFTRAAEEIGLSQPALSRSIARLEEELGQPVLERRTRQTVLTDAGTALARTAKRVLAMLDDVKAEIADDGQTGRVRVGAIPTIAPFFLPGLIRAFRADHALASVVVQEDTTEKLVAKLHDGEIDLAVMARPLTERYLSVEDLFDEELLLVMSAESALTDKAAITLEEIEPLPFVLLGEAHCLSDNILHFCRHNAFNPVSVERTSQLATVQELVALGHGVSLIPAMAQRLDTSDRRVYRSLQGLRPTRHIVMAWNPYRFRSRLVEAFVDVLRTHVRGTIYPLI